MGEILALAGANLLSPMVLCFVLGAVAALIRSDLESPEAVAKGLAIYLMLAIGMKGGLALAKTGGGNVEASLAMAIVLSFSLPVLAYAVLRAVRALGPVDAAAVSAHYGSVSIVTFVTAVEFLAARGTSAAPPSRTAASQSIQSGRLSETMATCWRACSPSQIKAVPKAHAVS